ncbi:MAG TPA: hypothetical protein VK279_05920, partial [Solirubrobacteraceae bacterium]|nr:hypothetical protein [Solirubrobacteraceae bacterium]
MTRLLALLALIVLAAPAVALGQTTTAGAIDQAAEALRSSPVYVAPDAELRLSGAEVRRLRTAISRADAGPVYIAVLPASASGEAGGDTTAVARAVAQQLGRRGAYAVVVGRQFRAGSTDTAGVGRLADEAFAAHRGEGVAAVLEDFVSRLGDRAGGDPGRSGGGGGFGGTGALVAIAVLVLLGGGGLLLVSRARRRRERDQLEDVAREARADQAALGEDIRALDLDVEMPGVDPRAREDYGRAVELYDRAGQGLDRARRPEDLAAVTEALEEGRYAMTCAKARLAGQEPPERRPPCFFDPRHGPSVEDVPWAPPGGQPRPVPVCAADAQALREGIEPSAREVSVGGRSMPYYAAPSYFSPYAGGFFGAFGGGLLPGLLIGSALGGAFGGWGPGYYGGYEGAGLGAGGDGFGGGDWGDGDFG